MLRTSPDSNADSNSSEPSLASRLGGAAHPRTSYAALGHARPESARAATMNGLATRQVPGQLGSPSDR